MTNRMKAIVGIGVFALSSVEQFVSSLNGRFFEQPIDPVFLLGIAALVYGIQKIKNPKKEVPDFSRLMQFMGGCLLLALMSIVFGQGADYLVSTYVLNPFNMNIFITLIKALHSFFWCLATILALLGLREVFLIK